MTAPSAHPRADPWAHRRGEPRLFAFLWTVYVLIAVGGSLLWLSRATIVSTATYGPAARVMLIVVAAGATVLWPMVRLSQSTPRRSAVGAALADMVVVLFPMQMVVWLLVLLAQWPLGIVAALAALLAIWVALIGGIIAIANAGPVVRVPHDRGLAERALWMGLCIVLVGAAPLIALGRRAALGPAAETPDWAPMLSPFTAILALTGRGFTGPQHPMVPSQWAAVLAVLGAAVAAWLIAAGRERARRGRRTAGKGGSGLETGLD